MRLGLVLGGGGVVGVAWEVGVLCALADALAWDPAGAAVLVGTSAGSIVGTQLCQGRSLDDLVADQHADDRVLEGVAGQPPADPTVVTDIFRRWTRVDEMDEVTAAEVGRRAAAAPTPSAEAWVGGIAALLTSTKWPDQDLRISAVSVTSGRRMAFTRKGDAEVALAVACSCAVPGLFPPVAMGDDRYVDGGVWSGGNADLLVDDGLDAVVAIGPLSTIDSGLGRFSARALQRERAELEAAGTEVHVVEPGPRFAGLGMSLMDPSRREHALEVGRLEGVEAAERLRGALG